MDKEIKKFVETYQCPGCVCGSNTSCFQNGDGIECGNHVAGTLITGIGKIFLGMQKGFNRIGPVELMKIYGFKTLKDARNYDKFNIPVWKYKDEYDNTIVRGLSPRINSPFLHIFLCDCISEIKCYEITNDDIADMD